MMFKRYEYPIIEENMIIIGSYTILENVNPLGFEGEHLVDVFEYNTKCNVK